MNRRYVGRAVLAMLLAASITVGLPTSPASALLASSSASLSGSEEVPPNASPATGSVVVDVDTVTNIVCINYSWANLVAPQTAAHIHAAAAGVNGPVQLGIAAPAATTSGTASQCSPVADALADSLAFAPAGFYFNVHTTTFPGGEIRGQLASVVGTVTPHLSLPGVVTKSTNWSLRDSLSTGPETTTFSLGVRPLVPVTGDWDGDGVKTAGFYKGGTFFLRNANSAGSPDIEITFGDARGFPVSGDFNGDGVDDVAVVRNGTWQVRLSGTGTTSSFVFGAGTWPNVVPVAGDWNADGVDGIGYYCMSAMVCVVGSWNLRNTPDAGAADAGQFIYNPGTAPYPVVGDWDADGDDTVGVKTGTTPATWLLNNANDSSAAETTFNFGAATDLPVVWTLGTADIRVTQVLESTGQGAVRITVTIANLGPDTAPNTSVNGTVGFTPGTGYVASANGNGGTAPPVGTCPDPGPTITSTGFSWGCSGLLLPAGTTVIYTIDITQVDTTTTVQSDAAASDEESFDPDQLNNSTTGNAPVSRAAC